MHVPRVRQDISGRPWQPCLLHVLYSRHDVNGWMWYGCLRIVAWWYDVGCDVMTGRSIVQIVEGWQVPSCMSWRAVALHGVLYCVCSRSCYHVYCCQDGNMLLATQSLLTYIISHYKVTCVAPIRLLLGVYHVLVYTMSWSRFQFMHTLGEDIDLSLLVLSILLRS